MREQLTKLRKGLGVACMNCVCHRALHLWAAVAYASVCVGADKLAVQGLLAAIYLAMWAQG